ncbi:MAG TPA: penicillin-binding protein 2 [Solirubrobacterales bacterium]|nr:penicillin-binding protein 2 [Solirubrobacterales bacterium]
MPRLERRVGILFFFCILLLSGILVRAFWLQGVQGSSFASQAANQQQDIIEIPGLRGPILDRNGQPLAGSEPGASIYATPYQIKDAQAESEAVAKALGADQTDVLTAITQPGGFSYVQKKVGLAKAQKVEKLGLEGIGQLPDTLRTRPQGDLASQVIGAVNEDGDGLTGLESSQEDALRGENGERRLVKDALGDPIRLDTIREASDGAPVELTLDAAIQAEAERVLAEVGETHDPVNASAIVMDTETSQVLAMANWPPVDLDNLDEADPDSLLNIGTSYTFEPGSTFKAFTVAAALQSKTVTPESTFTLAPSIQVYDRVIEEGHARGTITTDVAGILAQSSNVGAVTLGLEMGGRKFSKWIDRFGFGQPTGIEYPGEEQGIVLPYKDWSGSTIGNVPIGQGLSVTPIQMVAAYGALANDGILRQPKLIKSVGGVETPTDTGHQVISPEVAREVTGMLKGVLAPGGTASEVSVPGYTLAGKTGTAQIATEDGYSDTRYVASFMGIAPADKPRIAVSVMVNEPKNGHTGAEAAAPAFGELASFVLPYLGVPTE